MAATLEQLEGDVWPDPDVHTGLIDSCHRLRKVPVDALTAADLRLLLTQRIGVLHLVGRAIKYLDVDPLVDASLYPGDLLKATLSADSNRYQGFPKVHAKLVSIATRARNMIGELETIPFSIADLPALLHEYID